MLRLLVKAPKCGNKVMKLCANKTSRRNSIFKRPASSSDTVGGVRAFFSKIWYWQQMTQEAGSKWASQIFFQKIFVWKSFVKTLLGRIPKNGRCFKQTRAHVHTLMHKTVHAHTVLKYAHMNIGFMTDRVVARPIHPSTRNANVHRSIQTHTNTDIHGYMHTTLKNSQRICIPSTSASKYIDMHTYELTHRHPRTTLRITRALFPPVTPSESRRREGGSPAPDARRRPFVSS